MAYEKKIPVDMECPLRLTMSLIDSKWKSCILDELRDGTPLRPSEIHKQLPEAAPRVLDIQLKEMVYVNDKNAYLKCKSVIHNIIPQFSINNAYQSCVDANIASCIYCILA